MKSHLPNIFLISSIMAWGHTILTTNVNSIPLDSTFGLIGVLPISFWIALILCTVSALMLYNTNRKMLFYINVLVLTCIIWATPVIVEELVRNWDAWWHGYTAISISGGFSLGDVSNLLASYGTQWPGAFLIGNSIIKISGVTTISFLRYFPLIIIPISILSTFVLFRRMVDEKVARLGIIIFLLINAYLQFHFSPETFAIVLFPLFLLVMHSKSFKFRVMQFILMFSLIVIHPTTCLWLILFFIVLIIIDKWKGSHTSQIDRTTVTVFIGIFIVWFIFIGWWVLSKIIASFPTILTYSPIETVSQSTITTLVLPSLMQKIFFVVIISVVVIYLLKKYHKSKRFPSFELSWIIASLLLFGLYFISGGFFIDRVGLFMYFIVSLLLAKILISNMSIKKTRNSKTTLSQRQTRLKVKPLHFIIALFLITSTFFWNESPIITGENDVHGIEVAFQLADNNISLDFFQKQSYLIVPQSRRDELIITDLNYNLNTNLKDYNYSVILLSDNAEWVSKYVSRDYDQYQSVKTSLNANNVYDKFFDSGGIQIYVKNNR